MTLPGVVEPPIRFMNKTDVCLVGLGCIKGYHPHGGLRDKCRAQQHNKKQSKADWDEHSFMDEGCNGKVRIILISITTIYNSN